MTLDWAITLAYLMIPAYLANMAPPFVKYWRGWNRPISRRWLGDHKTVMGFAFGILTGLAAAYVQSQVAWSQTMWPTSNWAAIGLASGFGAMAGDSLKSLLKRRLGIVPGRSWIPADQLDFAIGAIAILWIWIPLDLLDIAVILVVTFVGDIAINQIAFRLGIRDTAW